MLRWNLWKTQDKYECCVGTNRKRKENISVVWKPIENSRRTQVLRGNLFKTQGKQQFCVGTYRKRMENTGLAQEPMENVCFALKLMENT